MSETMRLDQLMVDRGLVPSREQAKRLILAGEVRLPDRVASKPAQKVDPSVELILKEKPRFVGRGGMKIEAALDAFSIDPTDRICLDIGASTGGFTDCLLQRGAARVHAVDVGTNQLAWKLRNDSRVVVKERFNARNLKEEDLGELVDLIVIDVSFISLRLILPPAFSVLKKEGDLVCLIKPQFELSRGEVGKGGIVREAALHEKAVDSIRTFVTRDLGKTWRGHIDSPITGSDGNREFLAWLRHHP